MYKTISILGSTGSIGLTSLKIINKKKNFFKPYIFSANKNFNLICKQVKYYKPKYFIVADYSTYQKVKKKCKKSGVNIINKFENLKIKKKSDITISSIPGIKGLYPTIVMTKLSKKILIANKEAIICGWKLIKKASINYKTKIIPVDSEHFSIFKLLECHKLNEIKKLFITASGGPFLNINYKKFKNIKPKDALKHPKWKMGKKISIDSSTLMNKIFELIEAQKLFDIPKDKIDILIHPDSLVHAIAELKNGLFKFIYYDTSMIIPLVNGIFNGKLNIKDFYIEKNPRKFKNLNFQEVNKKIFPIIKIKNRITEYPSTPIIINAANEVLVSLFLSKKIPYLSISKTIMSILSDLNYRKYAIRNPKNIKDIIKIDHWARELTKKKLKYYD
jgi:1-deoxy-D-xylulose-5-phosphate reductoisomerase